MGLTGVSQVISLTRYLKNYLLKRGLLQSLVHIEPHGVFFPKRSLASVSTAMTTRRKMTTPSIEIPVKVRRHRFQWLDSPSALLRSKPQPARSKSIQTDLSTQSKKDSYGKYILEWEKLSLETNFLQVIGTKIEHTSLDWGGGFPGSHDFTALATN